MLLIVLCYLYIGAHSAMFQYHLSDLGKSIQIGDALSIVVISWVSVKPLAMYDEK